MSKVLATKLKDTKKKDKPRIDKKKKKLATKIKQGFKRRTAGK